MFWENLKEKFDQRDEDEDDDPFMVPGTLGWSFVFAIAYRYLRRWFDVQGKANISRSRRSPRGCQRRTPLVLSLPLPAFLSRGRFQSTSFRSNICKARTSPPIRCRSSPIASHATSASHRTRRATLRLFLSPTASFRTTSSYRPSRFSTFVLTVGPIQFSRLWHLLMLVVSPWIHSSPS